MNRLKQKKLGVPRYAVNDLLLAELPRMQAMTLEQHFQADPARVEKFSIDAAGIHLDYSKNHVDEPLMSQLYELAQEAGLTSAIESLFAGAEVNITEQRAALHTALRDQSAAPDSVMGKQIQQEQAKLYAFAESINRGERRGYTGKTIDHVIVLGIGGSYLGPKLVCEALKDYRASNVHIDFVATLDPVELLDVLDRSDSQRTLFIISSKSFGTLETLENAKAAKNWLLEQGCSEQALVDHFVAVTAKPDKAVEFGVAAENVFLIWDWVGGRYSLWSAIGLPILLLVGEAGFKRLLAGAHAMDQHFRHAPLSENMPVIMALLGVWYSNYYQASCHAIVPYSYRLRSLTEHLQQVDMESNGKVVDCQGKQVDYQTGPVIVGGMGNNGQHAYYQLLHQGEGLIPVDFIFPLKANRRLDNNHRNLFASGVGQSQALMQGRSVEQIKKDLLLAGEDAQKNTTVPHRVIPGDKPSNSILLEALTPESLGALLALYEHKIYCQGVLWNINSFDQWGVELGKNLASRVAESLENNSNGLRSQVDMTGVDASSLAMIDRFQRLSEDFRSLS